VSPPGFTLPVTVALVGPVTVTDTIPPPGSDAARAGAANIHAATNAGISPRVAIDNALVATASLFPPGVWALPRRWRPPSRRCGPAGLGRPLAPAGTAGPAGPGAGPALGPTVIAVNAVLILNAGHLSAQ